MSSFGHMMMGVAEQAAPQQHAVDPFSLLQSHADKYVGKGHVASLPRVGYNSAMKLGEASPHGCPHGRRVCAHHGHGAAGRARTLWRKC